MTEMLQAFDREGSLVKTQERISLMEELRSYSYRHGDVNLAVPAFHLILTDSNGLLYIVQRGDKDENPFLYDKTVGGHVRAGESYVGALLRESKEEVGVDVFVFDLKEYYEVLKEADLKRYAVVRAVDYNPWYKSIRRVRNGASWVKRGRVMLFIGIYDGDVKFHDGEAVDLLKISKSDLTKRIRAEPDKFTYDLKYLLENYSIFF